MRNIEKISKFSDEDFLNFLYSERNRYNEKRTSGGWTIWAICGSIFALCIFIYQTLKENILDYALCYYILASFCPCVLFAVYFSERIRAFSHGDSKHIVRLKDAAPKLFLFYISMIYLSLLIIGLYLHVSLLQFWEWVVIFVPIFISCCFIYFQRNSWVTSFDNFVIAKNKKVNCLLIFLITGAISIPIVGSAKHLTWGFSVEFECVFSLVLIVALSYLLLLTYFARDYVSGVDGLIDDFIFRNCSKEEIIKNLEFIFLGFRPNDLIQDKLSEILGFFKNLPDYQQELSEIDRLAESEISVEQIEESLQKIEKFAKLVDDCLQNFSIAIEVIKELLKLKTTLQDEEFVATLNTLLERPGVIRGFKDNLSQTQNKIKDAILKIRDNSLVFLCSKEDCPNRLKNETVCGCSPSCKVRHNHV